MINEDSRWLDVLFTGARARILYIWTTAKFKSANIFISATRYQTAKFKDRQYFRLYGMQMSPEKDYSTVVKALAFDDN